MLKLKKFHKLHQDFQQALNELSNEKAVEEMRNKDLSLGKVTLTWDALTTLKEKVRATLKDAIADYSSEVKKLFPDRPGVRTFEDVNEALKSPDWNTPEEKKAAEEIDKLKMNPLDMMDGRMFDTYFNIRLYYTKMTEEQRQYFRSRETITGKN